MVSDGVVAPYRLLERRGDERLVGIELAGTNLRAGMDAACAVEGAAHGGVVDAEGVGDGADRPVLGVEEATDLGALPSAIMAGPSAAARGAAGAGGRG